MLGALWTAAARAAESSRSDRLFHDPYAAILTGNRGEAAGWAGVELAFPAIRTRFFDDVILAATNAGVRQIVLAGAGLDTRAYRLPLPPSATVYELDDPAPLRHKHAALAGANAVPACDLRAVPTDLTGNWTADLATAGHRRDTATVWVAEGLLFYLSPAAVAELLAHARALSSTGSVLVADMLSRAPRSGFLTDDPAAWLSTVGWHGAHVTFPGARDASYGRVRLTPAASANPTARFAVARA